MTLGCRLESLRAEEREKAPPLSREPLGRRNQLGGDRKKSHKEITRGREKKSSRTTNETTEKKKGGENR